MARRITQKPNRPFGYRPGNSPVHRVPAAFKLLCLLALSAAAFSSMPGLFISAFLVWAAALGARIKPWELLRGCRPLVILSLFILVFKTIDPGALVSALKTGAWINSPVLKTNLQFIDRWSLARESAQKVLNLTGFFESVCSGLRIMVSFAAGSLLFAVTTMRELRLSLGRAEQLVRRAFSRNAVQSGRLSLGISLMMGFIPRFFDLWETVNLACESRAGKPGFRRLRPAIPLVIEKMMELAADTAQALEARGI
jgi:biotin transport system permease protein